MAAGGQGEAVVAAGVDRGACTCAGGLPHRLQDRDLADLVRCLHPDTAYVTDGGGKVSPAHKLIHGGELALVLRRKNRVCSVDTVQITDPLLTPCRRVGHPEKFAYVCAVTPGGPTSSP
jgi:hypothetical protein